jgi:hypothetical protein
LLCELSNKKTLFVKVVENPWFIATPDSSIFPNLI